MSVKHRGRVPMRSFAPSWRARSQEADESQLWLELLRDDCGISSPDLSALWQESDELMSIFVTMLDRTKKRVD